MGGERMVQAPGRPQSEAGAASDLGQSHGDQLPLTQGKRLAQRGPCQSTRRRKRSVQAFTVT